jgi:N-acylglucosamine 2-epimerase
MGAQLTTADKKKIADLAKFYRKHLLDDVMAFWEARTKDVECGGYLTCFDRRGNVTDTDKYIWFQARQLWMFSALYNHVEKRPLWLALAKHGRDFLIAHAYVGAGRWNYHLDRQGHVKRGTISIYTDLFVLAGLCEYVLASGSEADLDLIRETYDTVERNVHDRNFKDLFHGTWSPRLKRHGVYMITLPTAGLAQQLLGKERTCSLIDHCLEQILWVFARDEQEALFESVGRDGTLCDDPEGRLLNPGHALESMWFCVEEAKKRGNQFLVNRAIRIIDWMYRRGYDQEYGGIMAFVNASGQEPVQTDWHQETGMSWHDKCWWVHSEGLYALALAAVETNDKTFFDRFLDLHAWSQRYFRDPEYGEWYPELYRDGRPKLTDKGTLWKAAYHLPRALMKIMLLFEQRASKG